MLPQEEIALLQQQVELLVQKYIALQQQLVFLEEANQRQYDELLRAHAELDELRNKHKQLMVAHALSAQSEDRAQAKRLITALISKIDQTLCLME